MDLVDYSDLFDSAAYPQSEGGGEWYVKRCAGTPSDLSVAVGSRRFRSVAEALDKMGLARTPQQKRAHAMFLNACLPWIYGPSVFQSHRGAILEAHPHASNRPGVLVQCPRRFGKTTAAAMFCAAMLCNLPQVTISVFSTGRRASYALMAAVYRYLETLEPKIGTRTERKNAEELFVRSCGGAGELAKLFSYPSTVQARLEGGVRGARGCSGEGQPRPTIVFPVRATSHECPP